jgi:hypothetical protein
MSDHRDFDEVRVREFFLGKWYKELCRPFLSYFFHVLLCEFVIGLNLFFVFVSARSDIDEGLSAWNFTSGLNLCRVFSVI